ncbi:MAG TPA: hypothetical protein VN615_18340, partial [Gaiellales bacterium]|nr:hypothetical protein [Gaiellales bacterium]
PRTALVHKAPGLVWPQGGSADVAFVLGMLCSLPFDWAARRRVEATMSFAILNGLPVPRAPRGHDRIAHLAARLSCVDERYADFAREVGVEVGPMPLDERSDMEAEIDALVAHAYGLSENDLRVIFRDFTERAVPPAYRERVVEHYRAAS